MGTEMLAVRGVGEVFLPLKSISGLMRRKPMRGAKSAKWVVGAVVVALAATACGGGDGDSKDKGSAANGGVFRLGSTEPDTIDPGRAHESTGILLANALFTGLYGNTPDGLAEPRSPSRRRRTRVAPPGPSRSSPTPSSPTARPSTPRRSPVVGPVPRTRPPRPTWRTTSPASRVTPSCRTAPPRPSPVSPRRTRPPSRSTCRRRTASSS